MVIQGISGRLRFLALRALVLAALVLASEVPVQAAVIFSEDFTQGAGNWDNGANPDLNRPVGKYDNLVWDSPNVNADNGLGGGNDSDATDVLFLNTSGGGAALVLADTTFLGDFTVAADMTSTSQNVGIAIGDLYVLFHPGNGTGALRVQRISDSVQLIGNQNVGFAPSSGFDSGLHNLEVAVDVANMELNITLTDGTNGNGSSPYTLLNLAYSSGDYTPGTDKVGVRRGGNGAAWFDNLTIDTQAVPEPSTLPLLGFAALAIVGLTARRRRDV